MRIRPRLPSHTLKGPRENRLRVQLLTNSACHLRYPTCCVVVADKLVIITQLPTAATITTMCFLCTEIITIRIIMGQHQLRGGNHQPPRLVPIIFYWVECMYRTRTNEKISNVGVLWVGTTGIANIPSFQSVKMFMYDIHL